MALAVDGLSADIRSSGSLIALRAVALGVEELHHRRAEDDLRKKFPARRGRNLSELIALRHHNLHSRTQRPLHHHGTPAALVNTSPNDFWIVAFNSVPLLVDTVCHTNQGAQDECAAPNYLPPTTKGKSNPTVLRSDIISVFMGNA